MFRALAAALDLTLYAAIVVKAFELGLRLGRPIEVALGSAVLALTTVAVADAARLLLKGRLRDYPLSRGSIASIAATLASIPLFIMADVYALAVILAVLYALAHEAVAICAADSKKCLLYFSARCLVHECGEVVPLDRYLKMSKEGYFRD